MSRIGATGGSAASTDFEAASGLQDLDLDDFVKLMVVELQNQDPLDPLSNSDMLAQMSEIRSIGASDRLTETIESLAQGEQIAGASSLIGKYVEAINPDGEIPLGGKVDRVSFKNGVSTIHFEGNQSLLSDVLTVQDEAPRAAATTA